MHKYQVLQEESPTATTKIPPFSVKSHVSYSSSSSSEISTVSTNLSSSPSSRSLPLDSPTLLSSLSSATSPLLPSPSCSANLTSQISSSSSSSKSPPLLQTTSSIALPRPAQDRAQRPAECSPRKSVPGRSQSKSPPKFTTIESMIHASVNVALAPSGIPLQECGTINNISTEGSATTSPSRKEELEKSSKASDKQLEQQMVSLLDDLISEVGVKRAQRLVTQHVQQNHYLIVSTDGKREDELARNLRDRLEKRRGVTVAGKWSTVPGDKILDVWEKLSQTSMVVLVILSNDLFHDGMLELWLPEVLSDHRRSRTVPLFLEPLNNNMPPHLLSLTHRWEQRVYEESWNINKFVKILLESYDSFKHLRCEIEKLQGILHNIRQNPKKYVCPCGNC